MMNLLFFVVFVGGVGAIVFIYRCGRSPVVAGTSKTDKVTFNLPMGELTEISAPETVLLWSTQVAALRFLSNREPRGSFYTPLKLIYIELARQYPEIYEGGTFQNWVEFNVRVGLFRFKDDAIHITRAGNELLEYLENAPALNAP